MLVDIFPTHAYAPATVVDGMLDNSIGGVLHFVGKLVGVIFEYMNDSRGILIYSGRIRRCSVIKDC